MRVRLVANEADAHYIWYEEEKRLWIVFEFLKTNHLGRREGQDDDGQDTGCSDGAAARKCHPKRKHPGY